MKGKLCCSCAAAFPLFFYYFFFFSLFFQVGKTMEVFFVSRPFFLAPLDFAFQALEVPQSGCQRSGDIAVNN